jgi:pyruvate dehydrogenase E2 component (dihydrolipoamide acetyltransferase)
MAEDLPEKRAAKKGPVFKRLRELTGWRKVALGMWARPTSPTVYGEQRLDMTKVVPFLESMNQAHGVKLTPLHIFVKAVGDMFRQYPDFNVVLRRRAFYSRTSNDVFVQVAIRRGAGDLSGVKVTQLDQKTVLDVYRDLAARADRVRSGEDKAMEKAKKSMVRIPTWIMPNIVRLVDVLSNDIGLNLSFMGVPPDAWGGCMVTNIGSFGLPHGYAPLVPPSRVPMLFCLGAARDEPVAVNGQVEVRKMLTVTATFDHRLFDGLQIAQLSEHVKSHFEDPAWLAEELKAHPPAPRPPWGPPPPPPPPRPTGRPCLSARRHHEALERTDRGGHTRRARRHQQEHRLRRAPVA